MGQALVGLTLLAVGWSGIGTADNYPKNPNIDALNYAFRLTLSDLTDEIVGEAVIDLRLRAAGIERVRLDLIRVDGDGHGMKVDEVASGGRALEFIHEAEVLFITLAEPSLARQRVQIVVR